MSEIRVGQLWRTLRPLSQVCSDRVGMLFLITYIEKSPPTWAFVLEPEEAEFQDDRLRFRAVHMIDEAGDRWEATALDFEEDQSLFELIAEAPLEGAK